MHVHRLALISGGAVLIVLLLGVSGASATMVGSHGAGRLMDSVAFPAKASSLKIDAKITLGKDPSAGAYDSSTGDVYITNSGTNNVTVINSKTFKTSGIAVGKNPADIVYDPYNGNLYVTNLNSSSVSVIDGKTNKVSATVSLGSGSHPDFAYFDPANGNVLVVSNLSLTKATTAWIIANTTNKVTTLTLGLGLYSLATYSPATKDFYVPNYYTSTISVISSAGALSTLTLPSGPVSLAYDPSSGFVIVTLFPSGTTPSSVIGITKSNTLTAPTPLPSSAGDFVGSSGLYDSYNNHLYFDSYNYTTNLSYDVPVTPTATLAGPLISLGKGVFYDSFLDPANKDVYVGALDTDRIVVLDNASAITKNLTTKQPVPFLVYDPALKDMFGAGFGGQKTASILYAITSTNAVSSITVGEQAVAYFYDPTDKDVWVVCITSDTIDVVS